MTIEVEGVKLYLQFKILVQEKEVKYECRVKEGYCVDLRIFLTVEPLLAAYKITMFFCLRLVGVP